MPINYDATMTHGSLFSGIEGFGLGAHWAGYNTIFMVERNQYCRKLMAKHFPTIPIHDDIRTFDGKPYQYAVDVVSGGFPCQPFSAIGLGKGKKDHRYLWPEVPRILDEVRPAWVLFENVPRIIGMAFDDVCADLEGKGFEVEAVVLPASAVGADHIRQRVFFVGYNRHHADAMRRRQQQRQLAGEPGMEKPGQVLEPTRLPDPNWRITGFKNKSEVLRAANGVPGGLDAIVRIRACGNAVVPQLVGRLFQYIKLSSTHLL